MKKVGNDGAGFEPNPEDPGSELSNFNATDLMGYIIELGDRKRNRYYGNTQ